MNVGERIKERRQYLGMSADELADKLGKNRATIYRYESAEMVRIWALRSRWMNGLRTRSPTTL